MQKKFRGRESKRERAEKVSAALRFYAAGAPVREEWVTQLPPARTRKPAQVNGAPRRLEKHVLAEVIDVLRHDRRVALVERTQSGVFKEGNRYIRVGSRGKLDITGMLVGGRYFEVETKRPGEKPTPEQAERIAAIRANGGIAGYATSAEEALALLPS